MLHWLAPKAGTVKIGGVIRALNPAASCSDGVDIRIVHNATYIYVDSLNPSDAYGADTVGKSAGPNLTRTVAAGDSLIFFIGPKSNYFCDSTFWDPSVEYQ